ncbi:MAG: hypothetical protein H0U46_02075 [Actinobacteria bacterium]|nr:hypothetical protein [Actinomycetota bacterium]
MRTGHLGTLVAVLGVVGLLATARPAAAAPNLVVGAVEDEIRASTLVDAQTKMTLFRLGGFRAARITSYWTPGLTTPSDSELSVLESVAGAAEASGVRIYVTVMHPGSRTTPLTDESRAEFASFATAIVREVPAIRHVIVANEPNLNRFWLPQFALDGTSVAPASYLQLLAGVYDALKAQSPDITVYGAAVSPRGADRPEGSRHTHSPTKFIRELGIAYRASARERPIMDVFTIHPYGDHSSQAPAVAHPLGTSIGIADYDKLVSLLGEAFDGTAQPGSTLPILYGEYGVESQIPASKAGLYTGDEPATTRPTTEETQAAYYAQALALAFCQPNVVGILVFHSQDERARPGWQSGVRYVDGSAKSSLPKVARALDRTAGGSIARCPGVQLIVRSSRLRFGTRNEARRGTFRASLSCSLDCVWELRVVKVGGATKMVKRGRAGVDEQVEIAFQPRRLGPGIYRYRLKLVHPVNPGPPTVREGPAFALP